MITSALIAILTWVIVGIANVLPSGDFLPANFSESLSDLVAYAYGWDWLIPISTVFSVFSAIVVFYTAEIAWRGGKFLVALLRGN